MMRGAQRDSHKAHLTSKAWGTCTRFVSPQHIVIPPVLTSGWPDTTSKICVDLEGAKLCWNGGIQAVY